MYFNKQFKWVVLLAVLALIALGGCTVVTSESLTGAAAPALDETMTQAELEAELRESILAFEEAYENEDLPAVMAFYAEDVVSYPPNAAPTQGKAAVEAGFGAMLADYTVERDFEIVDLQVHGDTGSRLMAWTNVWTPKEAGDTITEVGHCLLDYEKRDGQWLVTREVWNTEEVFIGDAPAPAAVTTQEDLEAEMKAAIAAFEEAFVAGDADRLIALFAEDAVMMDPGMPAIVGKEAIEANYREFFGAYDIERDAELVDLTVSGDYATRLMEWTNTYTPKDGGEPMSVVGRCIIGYKKIDGNWKVAWGIWNTSE